MTKKDRLFFLDSARGFCMLLVILGHIWETDDPVPVLIYSFHVPLFFVISGILLRYKKIADRDFGQFFLARLKGLLIPYAFFEIIFTVIYGIMNHFDYGELHIYNGLLMNPLNVLLWFLPTLLFAELLIVLLVKAEKTGRLMTVVSALLYLLPFFIRNDGGLLTAAALRCCSSVGFVALGYAGCGFILERDLPLAVPAAVLFLDGILALTNGKTGIYKLTFGNPFIFTFCAAAGSFSVLSVLKRVRIRPLEWIGENTLVFLGLHIIVLRTVQLIPGFRTDTLFGGLAATALICILLIPVVLFMNRYTPLFVGKKT